MAKIFTIAIVITIIVITFIGVLIVEYHYYKTKDKVTEDDEDKKPTTIKYSVKQSNGKIAYDIENVNEDT